MKREEKERNEQDLDENKPDDNTTPEGNESKEAAGKIKTEA